MTHKDLFPEGLTGKALYDHLVANKKSIYAAKKAAIKFADNVFAPVGNLYVTDKGEMVDKAEPGQNFMEDTDDVIYRKTVINTTNWFDSHWDVHIDGLFKKSVKENKDLYLCEQHSLTFRGIITDDVTASIKKMSWRDLGLDIDGTTEALMFHNKIEKDRNEFMFNLYRKNRVKNHSVGMRYIQLEMCINNPDYKEEYAAWQKYYDVIANKAEVDAIGMFFAITEAKVIEGSSVVKGSNIMTPTMPKESVEPKDEITGKQPDNSTADQPSQFNLMDAIKSTTFIKS